MKEVSQEQIEQLSEMEQLSVLKSENQKISKYYYYLSKSYENTDVKKSVYFNKKALQISQCCNIFTRAIDISVTPPKEKIYAYYCKNRLCPICIAKNSKQIFKLVLDIVNHKESQNYSYIFLTLTIRNCKASELSNTITRLLNAYTKLISNKRNQFSKRFAGTFKVLESTYNKRTKEYHPHLHILAMVDKSYFTDTKKYLSKDNLQKIWANALGEKLAICDVKSTYNAQAKTVAEVSKYTVKSSEVVNPDVLETYDFAFKNRRLRSFTGEFKRIKNLVLEEWAKDSDNISFNEVMNNPAFIKQLYKWNMFKSCFELSEYKQKSNNSEHLALQALDSISKDDFMELKNL